MSRLELSRVARICLALCEIPSVIGHEQALADFIAAEHGSRWPVRRLGNNLVFGGPTGSNRPLVAFFGHLDTVAGDAGAPRVLPDRLVALGASDMKSGLAVMWALMETHRPGQDAVDVQVYQGENPDARGNHLLGRFMVEGLDPNAPEGSPVVFELALDLDGILHVEVVERRTGLKKKVSIEDAFRTLSEDEVAQARARLALAMGGEDAEAYDDPVSESAAAMPVPPPDLDAAGRKTWAMAISLLEQAERLKPGLAQADLEEVGELVAALQADLRAPDLTAAQRQSEALADVLFYLE